MQTRRWPLHLKNVTHEGGYFQRFAAAGMVCVRRPLYYTDKGSTGRSEHHTEVSVCRSGDLVQGPYQTERSTETSNLIAEKVCFDAHIKAILNKVPFLKKCYETRATKEVAQFFLNVSE